MGLETQEPARVQEPLIRKGEVISCWACSKEIGTVARDLSEGDVLCHTDITGAGFREGDPATCPPCGAGFYLEGSLHLRDRGWVPRFPF